MTPPEDRTAPGSCHRCGKWSPTNRVVAEIQGDSGGGATVVRCPDPCERTPQAQRPRTYQP